mgnify:CR=1 FL=1
MKKIVFKLSFITCEIIITQHRGFVNTLFKKSFKNIGKKFIVIMMSVQKLLIAPILIGAILLFAVKQGWISDVVMMVAVMQFAMPVGTLTVSIAAEYDSDYEMAAEGVFISTLLSIFTLPLIAYLIKLVL